MPWPFKQYGSIPDPVHKSHLNELTGEYGCPRRFRYQRDAEHAEALGDFESVPRKPRDESRVNAHLACGTAAHETISRALNNAKVRDHLLHVPGAQLASLDNVGKLTDAVRHAFQDELQRAADGRQLDWPDKESPDDMVADRIAMIVGTLNSLHKYAQKIIAVEPGFIVGLEGVWYSGHIDLIFEPRDMPGELGIADWKTGASKPDTIELAHSWEAGVYSLACGRGLFLPRECVRLGKDAGQWEGFVNIGEGGTGCVRPTRWQAERDTLEEALKQLAHGNTHPDATAYGTYPKRVYYVHMRDFVPYEKAGSKEAKRPEDLVHYGLDAPAKVKYIAGHTRGPGWLPVELHPNDVARLAYRARNVIGTVRMGRFIDLVREHCRRCPFSKDCLTGGYSLRGDGLAELQSELKKAGLL